MLKFNSTVADVKDWPYEVYIYVATTAKIALVQQWCEDQFGPQWCVISDEPGSWSIIWAGDGSHTNPLKFRCLFKRSEDLVLFSLRWS